MRLENGRGATALIRAAAETENASWRSQRSNCQEHNTEDDPVGIVMGLACFGAHLGGFHNCSLLKQHKLHASRPLSSFYPS